MGHQKTNSTVELAKKLSDDEEAILSPDRELEHPSYEELQKKLTEFEEKSRQYFEKSLRLQAEIENLTRRAERDVANAHKYSLEKFAKELLPVMDNLERAVTLSEDNEGIMLTLKVLTSVLEKFGIEQINPENQLFNPEFHQAISTSVDPNVEPGVVLVVMQKGYLLNGRLIRPALVVVSK